MTSLIRHLDADETQELFENLNYLNTAEFRSFCDDHSIPYRIWIETADGGRRRSKDTDRKPVVLDRIRHYLRTGTVSDATCLPARVAAPGEAPQNFKPTDRLYYGWYNKKNLSLVGVLGDLTQGRFKDGAVARVLIMELWTQGKAPTLQRFAGAWLKASEERDLLTPEYAYLTDLANNRAGDDWKAERKRRANQVLRLLRSIPRP